MILYHTSYTEIPHPDLLHSRPRLDFGVGFYRVADMHCFSDEYLVDELLLEFGYKI